MRSLFACCGGGKRTRRNSRKSSGRAAPSGVGTALPSHLSHPLHSSSLSVVSDEAWEDAREEFSVDGESGSRRSSFSTEVPHGSAKHRQLEHVLHAEGHVDLDKAASGRTEYADAEPDSGIMMRLAGCLSMLERSSTDDSFDMPHEGSPAGSPRSPRSSLHLHKRLSRTASPVAPASPAAYVRAGAKPRAGSTLARRDVALADLEARECWEECDGTTYQVRSVDYMRTRVKVPSGKPIYRLVAVDFFTSDTKISHVAQQVQLPEAKRPKALDAAPDCPIPPTLVINLQLPTYAPAIWGGPGDGPGVSIVYYFQLNEDFDPQRVPNLAALQMYERVIRDGREADGTPSRDRCKLIARVANVDDWAAKAPLNTAEYKLLQNYNEKPVMTRPQHAFHLGPGYMELDLDIHQYAFLARKAMHAFVGKLSSVVFEVALVLQGNSPEELPEQVLACGRLYRVDFEVPRPLGAGRV